MSRRSNNTTPVKMPQPVEDNSLQQDAPEGTLKGERKQWGVAHENDTQHLKTTLSSNTVNCMRCITLRPVGGGGVCGGGGGRGSERCVRAIPAPD